MHPCPGLMGGVDDLVERVEGAGVDVARLGADDGRPLAASECGAQGCGVQATLVVHPDKFGLTQAQVAQDQVDRAVPFHPGEHPHPG